MTPILDVLDGAKNDVAHLNKVSQIIFHTNPYYDNSEGCMKKNISVL